MKALKLEPWAARRLSQLLTCLCYGTGWLMAYLLWGRWAKVIGQRLAPRGGQLILSRHLSHIDPLLVGSAAWGLRALLRQPSLAMWFVPDRRRFRTKLARFFMNHLRCIPTNRDSHSERVRTYLCIGRTLTDGGNVWLAPGAKLESATQPLSVDPLIGFLVYHRCRQAELVAVRLGGLPRWDGVRLVDRGLSRWGRLCYALRQLAKTFGPHVKVEFVPLDMSDLLIQPEGRETYTRIAERIREVVAAEPGAPIKT